MYIHIGRSEGKGKRKEERPNGGGNKVSKQLVRI